MAHQRLIVTNSPMKRQSAMFEFEDDDFTLMESFSLAAKTGCTDFEDQSLISGTYLGDGVWVVDTQESAEEVAQASTPVSES